MSLRSLCIVVAAGTVLTGPAATARAVTFSNAAPVAINDAQGPIPAQATPYPSSIPVAGVVGTVTKVTAALHGFHHQCPQDVDALLVGPHGQETILMSDAGDCLDTASQPAPIELGFDDSAAPMPCNRDQDGPLAAGTYRPTNDPTTPGDCTSDGTNPDVFNPPAPGGPYPLGLAAFNGVDPDGTWNLYVMDQLNGDSGAIDGGWSLDFTIPPGTLGSAPTVTGVPEVGRALTALSGRLGNGARASYQWSRCNLAGASCVAIPAATHSKYRLVGRDRGHALMVTETAVTSGGSSAPLASRPTHAAGPPVVSLAGTRTSQDLVKQKGLIASIRSNIGGRLTASGTVSAQSGAKTVRLKTVKKVLRHGRKTTLKLGISKRGLASIMSALSGGRKVTARLVLTVEDGFSAKTTRVLHVRLK